MPYVVGRSGERLDVNTAIEAEVGGRTEPKAKLLIEKAEGVRKWNALKGKVDGGAIYVEEVFEKSRKLLFKYEAEELESRESTFYFDLIDPKTLVNEGKIGVTLRLADTNEPFEITKNDLIKLKASPEMMAYVSKRMNFSGVSQVEEWLSDMDTEKAKKLLEKVIVDLRELTLPYEVSRITAALQQQISEIELEVKRRKIEFVNAIERIVEERFQPIG